MKVILAELNFLHDIAEFFSCQSAPFLSKNPVYHKHIEVKYHFIQEKIASGEVNVEKIHIDKNPSNISTKVIYR